MYQKLFLLIALMTVVAGCATTREQPDPFAGLWDYELHFLPQGEPLGVMTIVNTEDGYAINMKSPEGEGNDLMDVSIEGNALTAGHFFAQGYKIDITGDFDGNEFEGILDAEGNSFRMTAVKQE